MKQCAHTKVWQTIVAEAREQAEQEPMLASFYHATIIKHDSLKAALSYILANRLNTASMPAMAVREVIEEAFAADPSISEAAACDICATVNRDPAVSMYSMPLLYLKGYHALQGYRVANWLWRQGRKALATYFQNQISVACQVDIHPAARIGRGIMLDHATGIVIGETAVVEDDVSICRTSRLAVQVKSAAIVTRNSGRGDDWCGRENLRQHRSWRRGENWLGIGRVASCTAPYHSRWSTCSYCGAATIG